MKLEQAVEIFSLLLKDGSIAKTKETTNVFNSYFDAEVKKYLDVLVSKMGMYTFVQSETIYIYAEPDSFFSMKNSEIKKNITGVKTNMEVYLSEIIFLVFLKEIFSGENQMEQQRNFITLSDLIVSIDEIFDDISESETIDDDTGINFIGASKIWNSLIIGADLENASSKTKKGFAKNVINFYCNEDLISKSDDTGDYILYPTTKLKHFIMSGNFDMDKFNDVLCSINSAKIGE